MSLLAGLLHDARGNRLSPSHAVKKGVRYRYYVSQAVLQHQAGDAGSVIRIPAREIEDLVGSEIRALLKDAARMIDEVGDSPATRDSQRLTVAARKQAECWSQMTASERRALLLRVVASVKAGREHRVPLSAPALAIVKALHGGRDRGGEDGFVFMGGKRGKPLSNMALLALLKRMDRADITAHGFRSTFRDWAAERTNYPREVAEMALGHAVSDKVEAAYRRGDLFDKRRRLMDEWAKFCCRTASAGKVVTIGRPAR